MMKKFRVPYKTIEFILFIFIDELGNGKQLTRY